MKKTDIIKDLIQLGFKEFSVSDYFSVYRCYFDNGNDIERMKWDYHITISDKNCRIQGEKLGETLDGVLYPERERFQTKLEYIKNIKEVMYLLGYSDTDSMYSNLN